MKYRICTKNKHKDRISKNNEQSHLLTNTEQVGSFTYPSQTGERFEYSITYLLNLILYHTVNI